MVYRLPNANANVCVFNLHNLHAAPVTTKRCTHPWRVKDPAVAFEARFTPRSHDPSIPGDAASVRLTGDGTRHATTVQPPTSPPPRRASSKAVFTLVPSTSTFSRILTSKSKFNLTPHWWASKNGSVHFLTSSKKSCHRCENSSTWHRPLPPASSNTSSHWL